MISDKSFGAVRRIIEYCEEIDGYIIRFGDDMEVFKSDKAFQSAVSFALLQIGELVTHMDQDFKNTYSKMPWAQIKQLRNIVVHRYGIVNIIPLGAYSRTAWIHYRVPDGLVG